MSTDNTNSNISKIDLALAAAAARKAAKAKGEDPSKAVPRPAKAPKADKPASDKPKRVAKTDAEKAAEKTQRESERADRKAKRDAERAVKNAEKAANKQPAHLSKVTKAGEKLPALSETANELFADATANLSAAEISSLAAHLQYFNRVEATKRALTAKVEEDMVVEIIGGDPRYIGLTGVVAKAQRIRCYVTVPGFEKDLYLFTSDVSPTAEQAENAPAPEASEQATDEAANA
jgi:hypothetical protein